jgi:hypothetical protein
MKTRQKKKNAHHEEPAVLSRTELVGRSLGHLNRSLRQFSEGLQTRLGTLQERLLIEPLEGAAWVVSQRVRKIQGRVFDFIDLQISKIDEARHSKLDHQTALERFDGEGGAMVATTTTEGDSEAAPMPPKKTAERNPPRARPFEPSLQH